MACFKNYKAVISDEQTANKCLNVYERVEVVERVNDGVYPYYTGIASAYERKTR